MLNNISYLFIQSKQSTDDVLNKSSLSNELRVISPTFGDDTTTQINNADDNVNEVKCYIHRKFGPRFLNLVYQEEFEPNVSNSVTELFGSLLDRYLHVAVREWLIYMYEHNLNNPIILRAILYLIIYYPELFKFNGITIALASISNSSCEIQELSIRVFENYYSEDSYSALCSIKKQDEWLQKYIDEVKQNMKRRLCL